MGDPTRHAIFRYVADARDQVGVAEVTEHFGLNHNPIRQHLAKLVKAGLVAETTTATGQPGRRRRLVYAIVAVEQASIEAAMWLMGVATAERADGTYAARRIGVRPAGVPLRTTRGPVHPW